MTTLDTVVLPLFPLVKVTNDFAVLPSCTFPKATLDGFGINDVDDVPVPYTYRAVLLLNVIFPPCDPEAVGLKVIVRERLFPAANINGSAGRLTL